jgi:hypothetical protein
MHTGHSTVWGKQKNEFFPLAIKQKIQSTPSPLIHAVYPRVREERIKFFYDRREDVEMHALLYLFHRLRI